MKKKKYDFIVGLGEDCACSMYLRKLDLQLQSYPFDWLTNASYDERLKLIVNDFSDFLNIEDIKFLPKTDDVYDDVHCDYYENTRNGFYYYHEFPKDCNPKDVIGGIKEKYQRRISRLYDKIEESEKVLFVWLSHLKNTPDDLIIRYADKVNNKFKKEIDFLIIENDSSKTGDEIQVTHISPNVIKYNLDTASYKESRSKTLGNKKNCNKILRQYELIEPYSIKLERKLRRFFIKFLCLFIPVKSVRIKLKSYMR